MDEIEERYAEETRLQQDEANQQAARQADALERIAFAIEAIYQKLLQQ